MLRGQAEVPQAVDGNGKHLGVFRTNPGYYWLLRFDPALTQHWLDHIGTALDVAAKFGKD